MRQPVELFRFAEGTTVYTQTRVAYQVVHNGETYNPYSIDRSQVESKNEMTRANVDITMARDNPVAMRYLSSPVDVVVTLTIFVQANGGTYTLWRGRLSTVKATGQSVTLTFESFFTSLRRPGLRARYQRSCRHALYGRGCNLDPELFRFNTSVVSASGNTVVVTSVGGAMDNRYRGGMIRGPDNTVRFVVKQIGTTLTLSRPFETLNDYVANDGYGNNFGLGYGGLMGAGLYPGCNHNMSDCNDTFSNIDRYGGFPWIPLRNPYGGSSIA